MALKRNITAAQFEKLSAELQAEYKKIGDTYEIDIEGGFEDTGALKRAKEHEAKARKEAEKKAADAEAELETLRADREEMLRGNVPKADVEKLEKSLLEKHAKELAKRDAVIAERERELTGSLVDNVATSLASEISSAPAVMLPHIKGRLKSELKDGKPVTLILDKDGKVIPNGTIDDLKKEFLDNKDFAPIITGSKGSGGGAAGSGKSHGGAIKSLADFKNGTEEAQFANQNPAEYAKLLEAAKAS